MCRKLKQSVVVVHRTLQNSCKSKNEFLPGSMQIDGRRLINNSRVCHFVEDIVNEIVSEAISKGDDQNSNLSWPVTEPRFQRSAKSSIK